MTFDKEKYYTYLKSPKWYRIRDRRRLMNLDNAGGFCETCLEKPAVHCHHISYKRIYRERMCDLEMLCEDCHKNEHPLKVAMGEW
jgi:hypothetical protein